MRRRLGWIAVSSLILVVLVELGDRVYLNWFASDAILLRFGSLEQIRGRGIHDRFSPHPHLAYYPTPSWSRGNDRHNSMGFRGPEITRSKPAGVFRIACLGGSTTYGNGVADPADAYPGSLQQELLNRGWAVEVVNAGCPGWSSLQSLINLQIRVAELSPDLVVVYHGINDIHPRLVWPQSAYRRDQSGYIAPHLFSRSWWEASSLGRTLAIVAGFIEPEASLGRLLGEPPATAFSIEFWRQTRDGTYPRGVFAKVPAARMLETNAPTYFEANLRDIVAVADRSGAKTLFMTWAYAPGGATAGSDPRLGTREYQKALVEQNDLIRKLSVQLAIPVLDLAAQPIASSDFVDGYHFTPQGNHRRAILLADLIERECGESLLRGAQRR